MLRLFAALSGRGGPNFTVDEIDGIYRLVWSRVLLSFDPDAPAEEPFGEPIPIGERVSNSFVLRDPGG